MGDRVTDLVLEVTKEGDNCFPRLKSREAFLIKIMIDCIIFQTWQLGLKNKKTRIMKKCIFWR